MTDINQISQVINQLAGMGVDLAKTMTPYALSGAKLQALHDLVFYKAIFWGCGIFFTLFVLIGVIAIAAAASSSDNDNNFTSAIFAGCAALLCGALVVCAIVSVFCFNDYIIAKVGYDHPDAYLAYQALNKITGG